MKSLQDYVQEKQTVLFNEAGAFFAIGQKQFDEKKLAGVTYCEMGAGLVCPDHKAVKLYNDIDKLQLEGIEQDKKENGKEGIIKRKLYDHECFYTHDIDSAVYALEGYNYTLEEIQAVFYKELPNSEQ